MWQFIDRRKELGRPLKVRLVPDLAQYVFDLRQLVEEQHHGNHPADYPNGKHLAFLRLVNA